MTYTINASEIYLENEILYDCTVHVSGGRIIGIGEKEQIGEIIDLPGLKLLPGLVDAHVHGGGGFDTMDGTAEAIKAIAKHKLKEGVTSFCPTTVTADLALTMKAVDPINQLLKEGTDGAKIAGVFFEGPYISEEYKGAHPESRIRHIRLDEIEKLINGVSGGVSSFLIAPEKDDGAEAIKYLRGKNVVVRIGHTGADYETAIKAVDAGATILVHTFNAMSPFASRSPGAVGAGFLDDRLYCELVCDLVHVHPASMKILVKQKPKDKIILITDCIRAGGLMDGDYYLGELPVTVKEGIARTETGALAGSTLKLNEAVLNMHKHVSVPLKEAVLMASLNPAKALGLSNEIGSIGLNKCADLIAVDEDMNVKFIMVDGVIE